MKNFIKLFEDISLADQYIERAETVDTTAKPITEGRAIKVDLPKSKHRSSTIVFKNPNQTQMEAIPSGQIRLIVDQSGDVYAWDGMDAIHVMIERALGLESAYSIQSTTDEITEVRAENENDYSNDEWRSNPNMLRAYGGEPKLDMYLMGRYGGKSLNEAPISDIQHIGNWEKNSSYGAQDRKLLTNPKALTKIKSMWKGPEEVDYNIILVNHPEGRLQQEIGEVDRAWLESNMPKTVNELLPLLKPDEVNIIYTNNSGAERVPMTGWVAAHRYGHVLFRKSFGKTMSYYYSESATTLSRYIGDLASQYSIGLNGIGRGDRDLNALLSTTTRNLMRAICTFKSARDGNLRTSFEALHELFAQYIITGKITFNDIPKMVKVGNAKHYYGGEDDYDHDNRAIQQDLAYELQQYFETAIHQSVGKIYVM